MLALLGFATGCASDASDSASAAGASGSSGAVSMAGSNTGVGGSPAAGGGAPGTTAAGAGGSLATAGSDSEVAGAPGGGSPAAAGAGAGGSAAGNAGSVTGADPGPVSIMAGGDSKCGTAPAAVGRLCDGFEGAALGAAGSAFKADLGAGSTAVVDTTKPYRGKNSVHIKTGAKAYITETATFNQTGTAATNNEMWGRVFIYFTTSGMPNSHDVFITLEDPTSKLQSAQYHVAGGSRGLLNSGIRFDNPAGDHYQPAMGMGKVSYVKDPVAWHCWEWHTTAANTSDFYIDGKQNTEMTVSAAMKWPLPTFKSLSIGFMEFSTAIPSEIWIDEVAVSNTARVGCND